MNVTCQKCNASVPEEQAFCQNCGAPMAQGAVPPPKRDDSWDMAATVIGQKLPVPSAPPVPQQPVKPAGDVRPTGRSAAPAPAPQPPPTPAHAPTHAPSHAAPAAAAAAPSTVKSNNTLYIILGVGAVLLLGILIIFLLMAIFS